VLPNLISDLSVGPQALGFDNPWIRRATLSAAAVVFPVLWAVGAFRQWSRRAWQTACLAILAWLPPLTYLVLGRRLVAVRFFLPFTAGYVAAVGAGLASLARPRAIAAAVALAVPCAVPFWHFERAYAWSYDHREVAEAIGRLSQPGDAVFVMHPFEVLYLRWYLQDRLPMQGLTFTPLVDQRGYEIKPDPPTFEQAARVFEDGARRYRRIWLVGQSPRSFSSDEAVERRLRHWLDERFSRVADLGDLTGGDPDITLWATAVPSGAAK
jgi:hypothetical protein